MVRLTDNLLIAHDLHEHAEEVKIVAETFKCPAARRMMFSLAESYEKMAESYRRMSR